MNSEQQILVLVIDDDDAVRELLVELLTRRGYLVEEAADGLEGWKRLSIPPIPDVVLLDWSMPRMSGLDLLSRIAQDERLQMLPVIMQTAHDSQKDIQAGIEGGAHYYVTKPYSPKVLESMVASAAEDHRRHRRQQEVLQKGLGAISSLKQGCFEYRSVQEGVCLAQLLARACPDPESTAVGLGELMINAVEHGNLGINYEDKTQLLAEDRWEEEVARRLELPVNRDKVVTVEFQNHETEIHLTITDQGEGFEWDSFLTIAPARAFDRHGPRYRSRQPLEFPKPGIPRTRQ